MVVVVSATEQPLVVMVVVGEQVVVETIEPSKVIGVGWQRTVTWYAVLSEVQVDEDEDEVVEVDEVDELGSSSGRLSSGVFGLGSGEIKLSKIPLTPLMFFPSSSVFRRFKLSVIQLRALANVSIASPAKSNKPSNSPRFLFEEHPGAELLPNLGKRSLISILIPSMPLIPLIPLMIWVWRGGLGSFSQEVKRGRSFRNSEEMEDMLEVIK
jgi:hypothetical protein